MDSMNNKKISLGKKFSKWGFYLGFISIGLSFTLIMYSFGFASFNNMFIRVIWYLIALSFFGSALVGLIFSIIGLIRGNTISLFGILLNGFMVFFSHGFANPQLLRFLCK